METDVLEVCRLCLSKDGLIWLFDEAVKMPENVLEVVHVTTGVKILRNDIVSQKICSKCCQITLKMYQFRTNALKHDKYLKNKVGKPKQESPTVIHISDESDDNKSDNTIITEEQHPSFAGIQKEYPNLRLPIECASKDLLPTVLLKKFNNDGRNTFAFARKRTSVKRKRYNIIESDDDEDDKISDTKEALTDRLEVNQNENSRDSNPDSTKESTDTSDVATVFNPFKDSSQNIPTESSAEKFQKYFQSIGLVPSEKVDSDNADPMIVGKSEVLSMCNICNKIVNSLSALKSHVQTHKRCRLCKNRYAGAHQIRCSILKDINSRIPQVKLNRIDFDKEILNKYPSAFERSTHNETDEEETASSQHSITTQMGNIENPILTIPIASNENTNVSANQEIVTPVVMYPPIDPQGKRVSSGLVKPDIKIKNDNFNIDLINPKSNDIKIIKDVLKLRNGHTIRHDSDTQTYLSDNCTIELNKVDKICKFMNLKQQLLAYKLPIEIEYGDSLGVSFKYDDQFITKQVKPPMNLWGPSVELKQKNSSQLINSPKFIQVSTKNLINTVQQTQPKTLINAQPQVNTNFTVQSQGNLVLQPQSTIIWQTPHGTEPAKQVVFQNTTASNTNVLTSASTSNPVQPTGFIIQHPYGQMHLVAPPTNASINLSNFANMPGNQQLVKLKPIPTVKTTNTAVKSNTNQAKPKILNFLLSPSDVRPAANTSGEITLGNILASTSSMLATTSNTIMTPKIVNTRSLSEAGTTNVTNSVMSVAASSTPTTLSTSVVSNNASTSESTNGFIRVKPLSDLR